MPKALLGGGMSSMKTGAMKIGPWSPARQSGMIFSRQAEKINAVHRKWDIILKETGNGLQMCRQLCISFLDELFKNY